MQWVLKLEGALGQNHSALGRDQERIAEGLTEPRQPGRHGGLAEVQAPGRAGDVPLRQQNFQRDEQPQIKLAIHAADNGT